jgi:Ca-activated chloride channel family protein
VRSGSPIHRRSPGLLLATSLALILALAAPIVADDDVEIRIVRPRSHAMAIGPTKVQVLVTVPDGAAVERVEFRVDGRGLATLTSAPWIVEWDAGNGSIAHTIEALLHTTDGRTARSTIRTSALVVNEVERVDLVNLYLVVRDRGGQYVTDLGRDDFRVFENRRPQTINRFSTTHKPLRVGIVLDTSATMRGEKLEKAKKSAHQFLDILKEGDEGLVVTFADSVRVAQELTTDTGSLSAAIENAVAGGGTALYDAVWRASRMLEGFDGRRVLVLLSDGRDEAANGLEPGSLHTLEEAIDQTLRSEAMVFAIGLGSNLRKEYIRRWGNLNGLSNLDANVTLLDVLESMADATGGRTVLASGAGRLRKAFGDIASDLRHQYSLAYVSSDPGADGKWRKVEVLPRDERFEVVTRKGYYAARPDR